MKSARFQTLGTNKKVIIVHPQTRYWSPVERTLKLFLTFFPEEKIQTQETGRPFVPVPFRVFLRGRFYKQIFFFTPVVYYESIKREPKIRGIYECRCDGRLREDDKLIHQFISVYQLFNCNV